jgi:hypothetical protein
MVPMGRVVFWEMIVVVLVDVSTEVVPLVMTVGLVPLTARVKTRDVGVGDAPREEGGMVVEMVVVMYLIADEIVVEVGC